MSTMSCNDKTNIGSITHRFSLPLHANPECLDPCVNSQWIAVPISQKIIGVWRTSDHGIPNPPIELSGHSSRISALSFHSRNGDKLASACKDQILTWDLAGADGNASKQVSGKTCFVKPGEVTAMCFNNNGNIIAAGVDNSIVLLDSSSQKHSVGILKCHKAMITRLEYCPHYSATLLSISDDRSFCVWDVNEMSLLYQSAIISSGPLICMSMNWAVPHVAIGSADGSVKIFDLTDGNGFRQLHSLDLELYLKRQAPDQKHLLRDTKGNSNVKAPTGWAVSDNSSEVESGESVLSIQYVYYKQLNQSSINSPFVNLKSGTHDVLTDQPPSVCMTTSNAVLQMNSRTYEIIDVKSFNSEMDSDKFSSSKVVGPIAYSALSQTEQCSVMAVVGTRFESSIHVVLWDLQSKEAMNAGDTFSEEFNPKSDDLILNIIPDTVLLLGSPLKAEMLPPVSSTPTTKGDIATGKKKLANPMNQPLTFKSKIKSSGYSQAPRTTMFKPDTSKRNLLNNSSNNKAVPQTDKTSVKKMLKEEYNSSKGPPVELCDSFDVDHQSVAVLNLRFADDGSALACSLSNKTALLMKSPFSKHKCTALVGHNNVINSTFFNSTNSVIITASNDKSALLWDKTGGDPIMTLTHQKASKKEQQIKGSVSDAGSSSAARKKTNFTKPNDSAGLSASASSENSLFRKEMKHAQFFYMDKFILLINGPQLFLYKYFVSPQRDEIKSYQSQNRYKIVSQWEAGSTSFTACAAVNTFFSHLVVCATTARDIEVYDLNKSVLAHTFSGAHNRPAYCVTINEGSCFASQPSDAHNVVASVAPNDPVKIWDLRTKSNVQALVGHSNGAVNCQIAFSPCGNYLASGSEDKLVYIYDIRMGTYCERLRGHNEVVCSVAFHPAQPLLASGGVNGKLLFFKA
ncbi:WD repeat-containing protein 27 [Aplysia californica]|uniref:WD repeat-containing protein 27 n=1 Tax=Aplysia californica TaxID=6500 RepID=A0ABM0JIM3_APLCA|nr:WD repeat-containing protein 27 [Aplysia californica]